MTEYATAEEEFEAILNGTHHTEVNEEEADNSNDATIEDTDVEQNDSIDDEISDQDADQDQDDSDADEDSVNEEYAQDGGEEDSEKTVEDEDDDTLDDGEPNGEPDEESSDTDGSEANEESENEDDIEKTDGITDEIDSKDLTDDVEPKVTDTDSDEHTLEYLKAFHEKVTNTPFKANGKMVKGFSDPDKLIKAQQMLYGYNDKNAAFKKNRPMIKALEKNGMIEDPEKFNLMMNIMSGDNEALKHFIKSRELDPITDLDIDSVDYSGKNHLASKQTLDVEDALESARNLGIEDKFRDTVGVQWDEDSFSEFSAKPLVREQLLEQMSTPVDPSNPDSETVYDVIQDKIIEMSNPVNDYTGSFANKSSINQYRQALATLNAENKASYDARAKQESERAKAEPKVAKLDESKVKAEKAKIIDKRKADDYKSKVDAKEKLVAEKRKKANSVSKKKPTKTVRKEKPDILKSSGQTFKDMWDNM